MLNCKLLTYCLVLPHFLNYNTSFLIKSSPITTSSSLINIMSNDITDIGTAERRRAALLGLYVADAVAMPVHWMYNLQQLKRDYGTISGYVKPREKFDGSILNLSNTGGGGRGSDQGDIVGTVILHGKKQYWMRGGNFHYHLGLEAGENTLEAQLCRVLTRSLLSSRATAVEFSAEDFTNKYMSFMQTPGSHNDTYASTAHRMFFSNLIRGEAPHNCADNDGHNVDTIDALTLTVPIIIAYADADRTERNNKIREVIAVTRKSSIVQRYAENYSDILVAVLHGARIRESIDQFDSSGSIRRNALADPARAPDPMVACYIDSSYPALLHFAYRYSDAPTVEAGVLASANAGGENVARGSLLGALLGAQYGLQGFPDWAIQGLRDKDAIMQEIQSLVP